MKDQALDSPSLKQQSLVDPDDSGSQQVSDLLLMSLFFFLSEGTWERKAIHD